MTSRCLGYRRWSDPEPDYLRIGVDVSSEGVAFVTFTESSSTWLPEDQAREVSDWVRTCARVARLFNEGTELRYLICPEHDDKRYWLGDGEWILRCGCRVTCSFLDDRASVMEPGPHLQANDAST